MKITATITPIKPQGSSLALRGMYPINGVMRYLTSGYDIRVEKDMDKIQTIGDVRHEMLSEKNPAIKLSWDDVTAEKDVNSMDRRKRDAVLIFYAQHNACLNNGKVHGNMMGAIPIFNVEIDTVKQTLDGDIFKEKMAVSNLVMSFSHAKRSDMAYYYGENPEDMSETELMLKLIDPNIGICMMDEDARGNKIRSNVVKLWGEESGSVDIAITARKAIRMEVIQNRHVDGRDNFYLNETLIGTSFEDVVLWCKRENTIYNEHIKRVVDGRPALKGATEEQQKRSTEHITDGVLADFETLKIKVLELKEAGYLPKDFQSHHYRKKVAELKTFVENAETARREKELAS